MSVFTFNKVFFSLEPRNISLYLFCFSLAWRFSPRRCGSPMSCNFKEFPSSVFQVEARWYFPPTSVQEHCRHRRSTSTRFRDSDSCSSASLTRGFVTKIWSRDRRCWQMRGSATEVSRLRCPRWWWWWAHLRKGGSKSTTSMDNRWPRQGQGSAGRDGKTSCRFCYSGTPN